MKPKVLFSDLHWEQAFGKLKELPEGTKLTDGDRVFTLDWAIDDPHPRSLWLKTKVDGMLRDFMVRRGDMLITKLRPY